MQPEVPKPGGRNEFRAPAVLDEHAVFDAPNARLSRIDERPAGKVPAVEQADGFVPSRRALACEGRRPAAGPSP